MIKSHAAKCFKFFALQFFLFALSGCYEYDKRISSARDNKHKHPEERIFDGEVEPPFPDEDENNKTLLGVDVNSNGVRDDIDIWINYVGLSKEDRLALRELARMEAARLKAGELNDSKLVKQSAKDYYDAKACAAFFERQVKVEESPRFNMSRLVYNTKIRANAHENYHSRTIIYESNNKDLHGSNGYIVCRFLIDNVEDKVQKNKKWMH